MIKNYYQRKVDGGDEDSLKDSAGKADKRRERGEELGPPPTPTPIVKRKYDSNPPQTTGPRPIAPHTDAMDVEENVPPHHPMPLKHVSPPQYPVQPRFPPSGQATPIPARRAMASPAPSTTSPAVSTVSTPLPKVDWTSRVLGPTTATPPPNQPSPPILDRDSRAYLSHRSSTLSQLNQPMRANPSPPPISGINHSRTPSLTTQAPQSVREQHPALAGPVHLGGHTTMQGLHPNPYGQSSSTSGFAHQPPPQAQPHAHHAHSNSI
ncbi:hypothetical protein M433DRAFT_51990, partial [Acidomyces richmondensis BFW]